MTIYIPVVAITKILSIIFLVYSVMVLYAIKIKKGKINMLTAVFTEILIKVAPIAAILLVCFAFS